MNEASKKQITGRPLNSGAAGVMHDADEWKTVMGLRFERREPCAMTYDEYGFVTILSGLPTIEEYEAVQKKASEYAKICEELRFKIFKAKCEYLKVVNSNPIDYRRYSAAAIFFVLLAMLLLSA